MFMSSRARSAGKHLMPCLGGIWGAAFAAAIAVAAPMVVGTNPPDGGANIALPTTISVTFSEPLDSMSLLGQGVAGPCTQTLQVSADNFTTCVGLTFPIQSMNTYTVTPQPGLANGTAYRIRVLGTVTASGVPMGTTYTQLMGFFTASGANCASGITISQVYADSGSASSAYQTDFVELHNPSNRALPLNGHSLQVAAAGPTAWTKIDLPAVSIPAGGFYLIALGPSTMGASPLPSPDLSDPAPLSSTAGRVALMSNTIVNTSACPNPMNAVDFVGYGAAASCSEGSPTANVSPTGAALRRNTGCRDTGSNADDFTIAAPVARNGSSPAAICSCVANETGLNGEIDYCNLQFPASFNVDTGATTPPIYAQVFESGLTESAGAHPAISAEIGYGPPTANPQNEPGWSWFPAAFNLQSGNNDEYAGTFTAPGTIGEFRYTSRFSKDGISWTYCDLDGAGASPMLAFEPASLGVMTVDGVPTPPFITSVNNTTFIAGTTNNFTVTATGFPTPGYSVQGALPPGVQFFGMTGVLTGPPSVGSVGGWPLVFTASNGVMPNATQTFALVVARAPCTLDIDANGSTDALSDGLMLIRAMFGLTGTSVTSNAVGSGAARTTWALIRDYLNGACGANFAQ